MHPAAQAEARIRELLPDLPSKTALKGRLLEEGFAEPFVDAGLAAVFDARQAARNQRDRHARDQKRADELKATLGVRGLNAVQRQGLGEARGASRFYVGVLSRVGQVLTIVVVAGLLVFYPAIWARVVALLGFAAAGFLGRGLPRAFKRSGGLLVCCEGGLIELLDSEARRIEWGEIEALRLREVNKERDGVHVGSEQHASLVLEGGEVVDYLDISKSLFSTLNAMWGKHQRKARS